MIMKMMELSFLTNPTFRQTNVDPFIEMVDLTPKGSLSTNFDSSKSAFKLLPPCSDQILETNKWDLNSVEYYLVALRLKAVFLNLYLSKDKHFHSCTEQTFWEQGWLQRSTCARLFVTILKTVIYVCIDFAHSWAHSNYNIQWHDVDCHAILIQISKTSFTFLCIVLSLDKKLRFKKLISRFMAPQPDERPLLGFESFVDRFLGVKLNKAKVGFLLQAFCS